LETTLTLLFHVGDLVGIEDGLAFGGVQEEVVEGTDVNAVSIAPQGSGVARDFLPGFALGTGTRRGSLGEPGTVRGLTSLATGLGVLGSRLVFTDLAELTEVHRRGGAGLDR